MEPFRQKVHLWHREAPLFLRVKVSTFLIGQVVILKICSYLSNFLIFM